MKEWETKTKATIACVEKRELVKESNLIMSMRLGAVRVEFVCDALKLLAYAYVRRFL